MKHVTKANHKGLLNLIQCGELIRDNQYAPKLAILMDVCGPSLFKVISDVKEKHKGGYVTFPCSHIKNIGLQLAVALDQLEKLGVYHLDVKPENIYFSNIDVKVNVEAAEEHGTVIRMSDLNIRIGDFGCSKFHDQTRSSLKKLTTKQTQNYRSPEIIMGQPLLICSTLNMFIQVSLIPSNPTFGLSDVFSVRCTLESFYSMGTITKIPKWFSSR